jgi:alpha-tubulin suppressor-like RCC1 family protein
VPVYVDNLGDDIKAIAAGRSHSLFLRNDGVALAVGFNLWGQLGHDNYNGNYATTPYEVPIADTDPDTTLDTEIVHIDANQDGFHSLFITGSGRALGAGRNDNGQLGINSIVKKKIPQLGDPPGPREILGEDGLEFAIYAYAKMVMAVAGADHTVLLSNMGIVYTVGGNSRGQLGDGLTGSANDLACSCRKLPVRVGISGEGTWEHDGNPVTAEQPRYTIAHVAAGKRHTLMCTEEGRVIVFGQNDQGQLGDASGGPNSHTGWVNAWPKLLQERWNSEMKDPPVHRITHVTAGAHTSFFRTSEGEVFATGTNWRRQLGTNLSVSYASQALNPDYHNLPTRVNTGGVAIGSIAAGGSHTVFRALECENNPDPCLNGAVCSNPLVDHATMDFGFTCSCKPGFTDGFCEYEHVAALDAQCNNTIGATCGVDLDECLSSPCGHGSCDDSQSCIEKQANDADCDSTCDPDEDENCQEYDECVLEKQEDNCEVMVEINDYACVCEDNGLLGRWEDLELEDGSVEKCNDEIGPNVIFFLIVGTIGTVGLLLIAFVCLVVHIRRKAKKRGSKKNQISPVP